ncbi:MAG: hypothetical protein NTX61_15335 [Bacteroidetes bacterium]|nr:hypothetical protein [Bacteroidota bacterium]
MLSNSRKGSAIIVVVTGSAANVRDWAYDPPEINKRNMRIQSFLYLPASDLILS